MKCDRVFALNRHLYDVVWCIFTYQFKFDLGAIEVLFIGKISFDHLVISIATMRTMASGELVDSMNQLP